RFFIALEAGTGLAFVAGVIGYLPVLYGAFSRREVSIILLDARAGSPPTALELLRRHAGPAGALALQTLLVEWERWSAELLESHISYPQLCFFRSQHDNQSWLSALVAILDTCALLIATVEGDAARQAQLTFIMARHAVLDLAHIFSPKGVGPGPDRLPPASVQNICQKLADAGFTLCAGNASVDRLRELRGMYEPEAFHLGRVLMQELPRFYPEAEKKSNWTMISGLRISRLRSQTGESSLSAEQRKSLAVTEAAADETHSF
ncbi:MAG: two pore domain potassium channel family protein, partial [Acidobacteriaceae bacterium]